MEGDLKFDEQKFREEIVTLKAAITRGKPYDCPCCKHTWTKSFNKFETHLKVCRKR